MIEMSKQGLFSGWTHQYNLLFTILIAGLLFWPGIIGIKDGVEKLEENFPFRKEMVSLFTNFRLSIGDRVFQQALAMGNGWLEYTGDNNLDDYQNAVSMNPDQLKKIQTSLESLQFQLSARQITLLIVVAPNKGTIYPEKISDEIQKIQQESRLDTLLSYFARHGSQVFIDLRPALLNAKESQLVYYRTDTHWNAIGAYHGYKVIIDALSENHPDLRPIKLTDFTISTGVPTQRDISRLLGASKLLEAPLFLEAGFDTNTQWITLNNDNTASLAVQQDTYLPKAIIYQDSFGQGLIPFLTLHFSKSIFISRGSQQKDLFSYLFIDQFDPDIMIIEIVERDLPYLEFLLDKFN